MAYEIEVEWIILTGLIEDSVYILLNADREQRKIFSLLIPEVKYKEHDRKAKLFFENSNAIRFLLWVQILKTW